MKRRLHIRNYGLSAVTGGVPADLYIDGIYAQLTITAAGTGELLIDGVDASEWFGMRDRDDMLAGPITYTWPVVYDTDGIPLRYDQRLRFASGKAGSSFRGILTIVYDTDQP